jgi:hypothetical protein
MHLHFVLAALAFLFSVSGAFEQPPVPPRQSIVERIPPGMTEIDGEKTPELIPDHVVWRGALNFLGELRRNGDEAGISDLIPLSKSDFEIVYREALTQRTRDEACQKKYRAREKALADAHASAEASASALDDVLIECRTMDLDAGDRVLDALSPEGRQVFTTYLERRRRSMSVLVPDREVKNFRLPR